MRIISILSIVFAVLAMAGCDSMTNPSGEFGSKPDEYHFRDTESVALKAVLDADSNNVKKMLEAELLSLGIELGSQANITAPTIPSYKASDMARLSNGLMPVVIPMADGYAEIDGDITRLNYGLRLIKQDRYAGWMVTVDGSYWVQFVLESGVLVDVIVHPFRDWRYSRIIYLAPHDPSGVAQDRYTIEWTAVTGDVGAKSILFSGSRLTLATGDTYDIKAVTSYRNGSAVYATEGFTLEKAFEDRGELRVDQGALPLTLAWIPIDGIANRLDRNSVNEVLVTSWYETVDGEYGQGRPLYWPNLTRENAEYSLAGIEIPTREDLDEIELQFLDLTGSFASVIGYVDFYGDELVCVNRYTPSPDYHYSGGFWRECMPAEGT